MLGPPPPCRLDQPIAAWLQDLVPVDHRYRHREPKLGLDFMRDRARELNAERGRPAIDPVIVFTLQVTCDTTCGPIDTIVALENARIHAFFPLPDVDHFTLSWGTHDFAYDAAADTDQNLKRVLAATGRGCRKTARP